MITDYWLLRLCKSVSARTSLHTSNTEHHVRAIHRWNNVYIVDFTTRPPAGMFYVMVDGKEGWVPSDVLKLTAGTGGWSMSSSMNSLNSRGRSHSRSVSPMPSRSPSPMDPADFVTGDYTYITPPLTSLLLLPPWPSYFLSLSLSLFLPNIYTVA